MLQGLNVEEIKRYNESLRAQRERASKLNLEIEINTAELNRICAELTNELGIQVNASNLEQIYNERVAKINSTLQNGTEILKRVAEEEQAHLNTTIEPKPLVPGSVEVPNFMGGNQHNPTTNGFSGLGGAIQL